MEKNLLNGNELLLYGDVGDPFGYDGFTAADVAKALAEHGPGDITARINSGGGIAFDGVAIHSLLKAHPGRITTTIDGVAASAASLIAMAGDQIEMRDGAMMMIHDPSAMTFGNQDTHLKSAAKLGKLADNYATIYAAKSKKTPQQARDLMKSETWMGADEAISHGFAHVKQSEPAAAIAAFDYRIYAHAPESFPVRVKNPKGNGSMPKENIDPNEEPVKAWAQAFFASAHSSGLTSEQLSEIVASSENREVAKDKLIDAMAIVGNANKPKANGGHVGQTFDSSKVMADACADAIAARITGEQIQGPGKELAAGGLPRIMHAYETSHGRRLDPFLNSTAMYQKVFLAGAHSTSDFPNILLNAFNKVLKKAYDAATSAILPLCTQRDVNDFRPINVVQLSEAQKLEEVIEGAEITYGKLSDRGVQYRVKSYAKLFAITRQALVNDDLSAFNRILGDMGKAAAQSLAGELVALLTANSGDGADLEDSEPMFSTARGNKAGSGAALGVTTLGAARQALRTMKGLDGETPIAADPKVLLVGPAIETAAEQMLTTIMATQFDNVNPFGSGKLNLAVEPRLAGNSWRLFADPAVLSCFEVAFLNGNRAPFLEQRDGWNILGTEFRAVLDFGVAATDWRGAYLNPGN